MLRIKLKNPNRPAKLRSWDPDDMTNAYKLVKDEGVSAYKASKLYKVPLTTLRDRVAGAISIDVTRSGPEPVLTLEEEARLVSHIKELASVGYGYSRAEVINLASDYAVALKKWEKDQPFSMKWFYNFMGRWPELKVVRPSTLSESRAKCANEEAVRLYFTELNNIIQKYGLADKPHLIYNIDEKGINTEFKPPNVVAGKECRPQAVVPERGQTITIIGAGNAMGHHIPPFFIFPGARLTEGLLEGKTPGADAEMSPKGWSNTAIFRQYLKHHFLKYCQGRGSDETMLVLYDGHTSHIAIDLIDWAKEHNIVMFVLPPHTSHILQPMDVGCFGPFQVIYNQKCSSFTRQHHRMVTKYDVCALACEVYPQSLSATNLQSSFRKAGIFPVQSPDDMVKKLQDEIKPSTLYLTSKQESSEPLSTAAEVAETRPVDDAEDITQFFSDKGGKVAEKIPKKKRRSVYDVIGGKALEGETVKKLKTYWESSKPSSKNIPAPKRALAKNSARPKVTTRKQTKKVSPPPPPQSPVHIPPQSPQPGPSRMQIDSPSTSEDGTPLNRESQVADEEKCCVCKRFYISRNRTDGDLYITNWVQCVNTQCNHWVHLKFCTKLRVARSGTQFLCNCCTTNSEQ